MFWSLWLTLVFLTNVFEGLKKAGVLTQNWKFASENYTAVAQATEKYSLPGWLPRFLFIGVLGWQALAGSLFWVAFGNSIRTGRINLGSANQAFASSLGLWMAFILADEIFKVYDGESSHLAVFTAQLVTLLGLHLLPV